MKIAKYLIVLVAFFAWACEKKVEESSGTTVELEEFEMPEGHAACVAYYEGVRVACVNAAEGKSEFDCAGEFGRLEKMQADIRSRLEAGDPEDKINTEVCQAAYVRLASDPTLHAEQ